MKENRIYNKLNDIEINYEEVELNDLEKEKLRKTAKSFGKVNKKKRSWKKFAGLAAALVLIFGTSNLLTGGQVWARTLKIASQIQVSLAEAVGLSTESSKYSVKLNEPVLIGDKEFRIEEVAVDGKDIYTVVLGPREVFENPENSLDLSSIRINGKKNRVLGSGGSVYELEEDPSISVTALMHNMEKPLPEEGLVELELFFNEFPGLGKNISISMELDMSKLSQARKVIVEDMEIKGSNKIKIDSFTMSPIAQKIVLSYPEDEGNYIYSIEAKDSLKREINFELRYSDKGYSNLYFSPVISEVTADQVLNEIDSLECQLYRQEVPEKSGRIDTPVEKVGEAFEIKLR